MKKLKWLSYVLPPFILSALIFGLIARWYVGVNMFTYVIMYTLIASALVTFVSLIFLQDKYFAVCDKVSNFISYSIWYPFLIKLHKFTIKALPDKKDESTAKIDGYKSLIDAFNASRVSTALVKVNTDTAPKKSRPQKIKEKFSNFNSEFIEGSFWLSYHLTLLIASSIICSIVWFFTNNNYLIFGMTPTQIVMIQILIYGCISIENLESVERGAIGIGGRLLFNIPRGGPYVIPKWIFSLKKVTGSTQVCIRGKVEDKKDNTAQKNGVEKTEVEKTEVGKILFPDTDANASVTGENVFRKTDGLFLPFCHLNRANFNRELEVKTSTGEKKSVTLWNFTPSNVLRLRYEQYVLETVDEHGDGTSIKKLVGYDDKNITRIFDEEPFDKPMIVTAEVTLRWEITNAVKFLSKFKRPDDVVPHLFTLMDAAVNQIVGSVSYSMLQEMRDKFDAALLTCLEVAVNDPDVIKMNSQLKGAKIPNLSDVGISILSYNLTKAPPHRDVGVALARNAATAVRIDSSRQINKARAQNRLAVGSAEAEVLQKQQMATVNSEKVLFQAAQENIGVFEIINNNQAKIEVAKAGAIALSKAKDPRVYMNFGNNQDDGAQRTLQDVQKATVVTDAQLQELFDKFPEAGELLKKMIVKKSE